MKLSELLDEPP